MNLRDETQWDLFANRADTILRELGITNKVWYETETLQDPVTFFPVIRVLNISFTDQKDAFIAELYGLKNLRRRLCARYTYNPINDTYILDDYPV